jgi:hypothetical protein
MIEESSEHVPIILIAFGMLRSKPRMWTNPPFQIRVPVLNKQVGRYSPPEDIKDVQRGYLVETAAFEWTGLHENVDGVWCRVYELINAKF